MQTQTPKDNADVVLNAEVGDILKERTSGGHDYYWRVTEKTKRNIRVKSDTPTISSAGIISAARTDGEATFLKDGCEVYTIHRLSEVSQ